MEQLAHGLSKYRELEAAAKLDAPFFLALLADAYGRARSPEEGLKRLAEAEYLIEVTGERWAEAELHRIRGRLQQNSGSCVSAEESFHQAIRVARLQNARLWELRAAADLARLWRDQGKPAISSHRPTAGSPKVSTRRSCKTPRRCSISWRDA